MGQHGNGKREELLDKLRSMLAAGEVPVSALKTRRKEFGISQHELARLSGVSQAVISRIEAGGQLPTNAQTEKLGEALKVGSQDLGLAETMTLMGRLAAKGKLPPEAAADFAAYLMTTQPDSEAARRVDAAVLGALVDITETASEARDGAAVAMKSQAKAGRDARGIRLVKPHGIPDQRHTADDRDGAGRRRRDAQGRVIKKSYDPLSLGK
jgi:transcriptional regulator with XRE-family HTH domain